MTISLRISETDAQLIKAIASYNNESASNYIRRIVMENIEEEYMKALEDYLNIPDRLTRSHI